MFGKARTGGMDEADIQEAVIRKQMQACYRLSSEGEAVDEDQAGESPGGQPRSILFFVSIDGKDPNEEFLHRFHVVPGSIRRVSQSRVDPCVAGKISCVADKKTGERGIVVGAGAIRWISADSVEAEGWYQFGALAGRGTTYRLDRESGKWVLKSERARWIS